MKKTLKRTLATFLTVIMLFSALPLAGVNLKASALASSGKCGDNVSWSFNSSTGTLTISGTGKMYNYVDSPFEYNDSIKNVIINKGVTSISDWAFYDCDSLTEITIPDSVTSIGNDAFYDCSSLTSVTIGSGVKSISWAAFNYCNSLTSVTVDENNTVYDSRDNCNAIIETATNTLVCGCGNTIIPDSVTSIGEGAFYACDSLTSITIPDSVKSIGVWAFSNCDSLTSVTIGNGVTSIGDDAFSFCDSLTSITIPDSVTSISDWAFYACDSLTSITIPDSVTSIGDYAFYYCDNLTDVYYNGTEKQWDRIIIGEENECLTNATIHYNEKDGFRIYSNSFDNYLEVNNEAEYMIGYYVDDVIKSNTQKYIYTVSDSSIIKLTTGAWDNNYGSHITIKALKEGTATLTVTNPDNGQAAAYEFFVSDPKNTYNFNNLPKKYYEAGKATNFYNYSGMVVNDFKSTAHYDSNKKIDYYDVTMTIYNKRNIIGAVTAFDEYGNLYSYQTIDRMPCLDENFVGSVKTLYYQTGDLYYLLGNKSFYSGKSMSKETNIKVKVPVGGYLVISNNIAESPVALIANIVECAIETIESTKKWVDLFDLKGEHIGETTRLKVDKYIIDKYLKYGNKEESDFWKELIKQVFNKGTYGKGNAIDFLSEIIDTLSGTGINIMEDVIKEIASIEGFAETAEKVATMVIPFGEIINCLYNMNDGLDVFTQTYAFENSSKYPKGICIYAPNTNKEYKSNGIIVKPQNGVIDSSTVVHTYQLVTVDRIPITTDKWKKQGLDGDYKYEQYDITMYKNGNITQPTSNVNVSIPLPDGFSNREKVMVFRVNDDGSLTNMNAKVQNGYAVFTTNHFSIYMLACERGPETVELPDIEVYYKNTATLTPNITIDSDINYTVKYESSNPSVATVDKNGNISTVHKGTTTITCTVTDEYGNTVKDTCTVNVKFQWWQWLIWILLFGFLWY